MDLGETEQSLGPESPKLIARTRWKLLAKVVLDSVPVVCQIVVIALIINTGSEQVKHSK